MRVHDFEVLVTKKEGKKKSVSVAQVKEIRKIMNKLLDGWLNTAIKELV